MLIGLALLTENEDIQMSTGQGINMGGVEKQVTRIKIQCMKSSNQ